jgi:DNA-binding CsgD family transcriptional regulator/predicted ATPase
VVHISAPSALVGRETQLRALREFAAHVAAGTGGTLVVRGDAGTGKTSLARTLVAEAREAGTSVMTGGCVAIGGEPLRHAALIECLRSAGRAGVAGLSTEEVLERVLAEVDGVRAPESLLLVVEDVHWADRSTCEILTVLTRHVAARRAGLVLTCRDDDVAPDHYVRRFLSELLRAQLAVLLRVEVLSASDSAALIERLLGNVDAKTVAAIYRRSGGNPLVIEELCAGGVEGATRALDGALREIMLTRFWRLSPAARDLVRAVSVAAGAVYQHPLALVAEMHDDEVAGALREAVDLHVLTLDGETIGFRHVLMSEAVYDDLLPGERVALHGRWANVLTNAGATDASLLAHHWFEARDSERAFDSCIAAARSSAAMLAFDAAHRHYRRALSLWDRVSDATARAGCSRADLCLSSAETANWAGDPSAAVADIEVALGSGDAADATTRSVLLERRAWYLLRQGDSAAARAEYEAALAALPDDAPPATRARVLAGSVRAYERAADFEAALAIARDAVRLAVDAEAVGEIGPARYMLGRMLSTVGDLDASLDELERSARAAEEALNPVLIAVALLERADALARSRRLEEAVAPALAASERLRARGHVDHALLAAATAAAVQLRLGRVEEAGTVAALVVHDAQSSVTQAIGHLLAGASAVELGDATSAREHLETARLLAAPLLDGRVGAALATARAELALLEQNVQGAIGAVEEGITRVVHSGDDEALAHLCLLGLRSQAEGDAAALGRASERSRRRRDVQVGALEQHLGRVLAARPAGVARPDLDAIRAAWDAARARLDGRVDPSLWERAASAWAAVQWPRWRAYCEMRGAEALARTDAPAADVAGAFERAAGAIGAVRSAPLSEELGRLARGAGVPLAGGDTPTEAPPPPEGNELSELTRREREVLELVVDGATNRQIASRLFISEKTASVHVSRILTKLGATTRQDAAALARRARQQRRR